MLHPPPSMVEDLVEQPALVEGEGGGDGGLSAGSDPLLARLHLRNGVRLCLHIPWTKLDQLLYQWNHCL